jgi:hypothetical protein
MTFSHYLAQNYWREEFSLWGLYVVGQILSVLMRADLMSASSHTPWKNTWDYMHDHIGSILYRSFISTTLFWIWWRSPQLYVIMGFDVGKHFPLTPATAGLYGVVSDKIVNYLMSMFLQQKEDTL